MAPRYIKVLTSDGFTFVIPREAALVSGTWNLALSSESNKEAQTGVLPIKYTALVMASVIDYLFFHLDYRETGGQPVAEFQVPPELALVVLEAADYLNV